MRTLILTATSLFMLGGAASAADLGTRPVYKAPVEPPPPVATWTGFYIGLNAGGGWGVGSSEFSIAGVQFASVDNHLQGAIGGGQIGFNWQNGIGVIGLEADFQAANVEGSLTAPCIAGACALTTATYSQSMPWFGTVRGRLGVASPAGSIYITGGYAYARLETDAFAAAGPVSATFSRDETRHGWTAGGGIEVMLSRNWTAKVEYFISTSAARRPPGFCPVCRQCSTTPA